MENFCQHIEKLLAHHDFVVIPGLGGFVVQNESAQIYSHYITPPLAHIGFNPLMQNSDGLLAIEISRSKQISYRMAMEYITNEVNAIHRQLKTNTEVQFGDLGTFIQIESDKIQFKPIERANYLPQNFGLNNVFAQTITIPKIEKSKKISIEFKPTRFYKYAAVMLMLIGLFLSTNKVSDVRQRNNADFSHVSLFKTPITTTDSILKLTTDTVASIDTVETENFHFHVIVASLRNEEDANTFCNSLKEKDFQSAQVLPPAKTYRVAIQSFSDRDEAIQYMEHLRATDNRFETAWVLCN